jgi:hypothetical protein
MVAVLVFAGLQLSACAQKPATTTAEKPAHVEPIEGTDLKRVVLTEKAAERLGIETTPVLVEQVKRTRRIGGRVVAARAAPATGAASATGDSKVYVRLSLNESDLSNVDRNQPARILSLESDDGEDSDQAGTEAEVDEAAEVDDAEDANEAPLYYVVAGKEHGLTPGQRVFVEIAVSGGRTTRKVIPYSAVIYDVKGATWTYANPEPLVFVRQPISVDYIQRGLAYLSEGPAEGTAVVTGGAAELYGTETGVGK